MNSSFSGTLMSSVTPGLVESLADAALKCSLLLLVSLTVANLARHQSPAWRGWVLTLAFISLPVVFAVSFVFPEWRWQQALALHPPEFNSTPSRVMIPPQIVNIQPLSESRTHPREEDIPTHFYSFAEAAFQVWAIGSTLTGLFMLARQACAINRRRSYAQLHRGPLVDLLEDERRQASLKKRPTLHVAGDWVMPSTWGLWHPAILLPRQAKEWPLRKLQHVLRHEIAHIARRDALTSLLSSPAVILLWFNPLVWIARHQSCHLREAACDDWVLIHGKAEGPAYSADLLAIVRQHARFPRSVG